jgi:hypothetical protein
LARPGLWKRVLEVGQSLVAVLHNISERDCALVGARTSRAGWLVDDELPGRTVLASYLKCRRARPIEEEDVGETSPL